MTRNIAVVGSRYWKEPDITLYPMILRVSLELRLATLDFRLATQDYRLTTNGY